MILLLVISGVPNVQRILHYALLVVLLFVLLLFVRSFMRIASPEVLNAQFSEFTDVIFFM